MNSEADMSDKLPGNGLFGWFGRQVGYVKKAVTTKPTATPPAKRSAPQSGTPRTSSPHTPKPPVPKPADQSTGAVLYRQGQVQETEHPTQPGMKLRRTIIDEVIVDPRDDSTGNS